MLKTDSNGHTVPPTMAERKALRKSFKAQRAAAKLTRIRKHRMDHIAALFRAIGDLDDSLYVLLVKCTDKVKEQIVQTCHEQDKELANLIVATAERNDQPAA